MIPALVRKVVEARVRGDQFIELWGTGSVTGNSYVEDAAEGNLPARNGTTEPSRSNSLGTGDIDPRTG